MSTLLPMLMTFEKPMFCASASSTVAAQMAPLCDTSATTPYFGVIFRKVEFIMLLVDRLIMPRQFGPITRIPYFLAISPTSFSSFAPASSTSLNPAETIIAPLIPFLPTSSITAGVNLLGAATTARSTDSETSRTLLYAFSPPTVGFDGVMGKIFPLKCFAILLKIVLPTPGFSEAPMTAIDLGEKKIELDMGEKPLRVVINASSLH